MSQQVSLPIVLLKKSNSYFSSGSGFNLLIRFIQYSSKILISRKIHQDELKKLYTIISDSRFLFRFWGFFDTVEELHTLFNDKSLTSFNRTLELVKSGSMIGYYPLEHLYWLKWKGIYPAGKWLDIDEFSYWSCRFWAIYIVADMIQDLMRIRSIPNGKAKMVYILKWIMNISDMFLAVHWSIKDGLLSEEEVGWFGSIGSLAGIARLISSR